jgi:hypothetical protein
MWHSVQIRHTQGAGKLAVEWLCRGGDGKQAGDDIRQVGKTHYRQNKYVHSHVFGSIIFPGM